MNHVSAIVGEIAKASGEQTRGVDEVNRSMSAMDRVVQDTAASAQESSSSAEEMASEAKDLASMVGRFRITMDTDGAVERRSTTGIQRGRLLTAAIKGPQRADSVPGSPTLNDDSVAEL